MWTVDRIIRTARNLVFNFRLNAKVEVLSPDFLRITLRRPNYVHWVPGQCAYLTIPGFSSLGSHPFTISTIDVPPNNKKPAIHSTNNGSLDESKQLTFLVRVHKGFTRRVRSAARDDESESMNIFFDGPYGEPPLLTGFETVIFIAGVSLSALPP